MRRDRPLPPFDPPEPPAPEPLPSRLETLSRRGGRIAKRFQGALLVTAGIAAAMFGMWIFDSLKPPPQRLTQRDINAAVARAMASATPTPFFAAKAYEIIRPSLVRVESTQVTDSSTQPVVAAGVVIDDQGTIIASLHVVGQAATVRVVFADGTESDAEVVVRDPPTDLVALRPAVIPDDLTPAVLAGSDSLRVGDQVVAVGNPFGMNSSLSAGVVSGLGRQQRQRQTGEILKNLIQFDAAVNPGNSGGPLLNRDGEVVGIVSGLFNPSDDVFIGIGFAVRLESAGGGLGSPVH